MVKMFKTQMIFLSTDGVMPEEVLQDIPCVVYVDNPDNSLSDFQKDYLSHLKLPIRGAYNWAQSLAKPYLNLRWQIISVRTPLGQSALIACHEGRVLFVRYPAKMENALEETKTYLKRFGLFQTEEAVIVELAESWPKHKAGRLKEISVWKYCGKLAYAAGLAVCVCGILYEIFSISRVSIDIAHLRKTMPVVMDTLSDKQDQLAQLVVLSDQYFPVQTVLEIVRKVLLPEIVIMHMDWDSSEVRLHLALATQEVLEPWVETVKEALPGYQIEASDKIVRIKR